MCGILGFASTTGNFNQNWIFLGRDKLNHRGPDSFGSWISPDRKVSLHHRRLSIIDINSISDQPMTNENSTYSIVFNGEIYNYKELRLKLKRYGKTFKTNSDTEVLLEAYKHWGDNCVEHLNGMFSFAIYDHKKNIIFLARDRAGEKPLFFYHKNGSLFFASELKALLENPSLNKNINFESLDCYLSMGYIPQNLCILEGYNKLPPAHFMKFNLITGKLEVSKYWDLPQNEINYDANENDLLIELENLLEDSVKKQLTSDVPIGVLLSGGIDSSLITAFASRFKHNLKTFTVRVPGDNLLDETQHARLIANYFNTEHLELEAKEPDVDLLIKLAKQFDEPMADSSMIPTYLVSRLIKKHCTVALGGDGGDELFGGYGHYPRLIWMEKYLGKIPFQLRSIISDISCNLLPIGFKGRNWLSAMKTDFNTGLPLVATQFDRSFRIKLIPKLEELDHFAEKFFKNNIPSAKNILERATRMDFNNYLTEDILVKVDRSSMANSLEIRAPMLDFRIIEFAYKKVPDNLKATISDKKILLKKLTQKILPKEFDRDRKQGFSIPLSKWLRKGSFRDFFYDTLNSKNCMFEKKPVQELLQGQDHGRSNSERLFSLVMLEIWKNEYDVSI